jgi:hypothetical protein
MMARRGCGLKGKLMESCPKNVWCESWNGLEGLLYFATHQLDEMDIFGFFKRLRGWLYVSKEP